MVTELPRNGEWYLLYCRSGLATGTVPKLQEDGRSGTALLLDLMQDVTFKDSGRIARSRGQPIWGQHTNKHNLSGFSRPRLAIAERFERQLSRRAVFHLIRRSIVVV